MRTLLIDGDILSYQAAFRNEETFEFEKGHRYSVTDEKKALQEVRSTLDTYATALKADKMIIAMGDKENFRREIYPAYKAHRVKVRRPALLDAIKAYLQAAYEVHIRPRLEGDDILGILATRPNSKLGTRIVVSSDKDLRSIPGLLWNPSKARQVEVITEEQADYWHMYQTLVGDTTDNYPGCPGIGPKKAEKVLRKAQAENTSLWAAVVETYQSRHLTEEDALVQARLARIIRWSDYNVPTHSPILWRPQCHI